MRVKLVLKNMSDPMRQLRLDMPRTMLPMLAMSVTTITFCLLSAMVADQATMEGREGGVIRQGKAEERQGQGRAKPGQCLVD